MHVVNAFYIATPIAITHTEITRLQHVCHNLVELYNIVTTLYQPCHNLHT